MTSPVDKTEPFPTVDDESSIANANADSPITGDRRSSISNRPKASSSISGRLRRLSASFEQSELPEGFFAATSGITSSMLSGRSATRSIASSTERRDSASQRGQEAAGPTRTSTFPSVLEEEEAAPAMTADSTPTKTRSASEPAEAAAFPNGYHFPPKHTFGHSSKLAAITFWHYFTTPVGFFVTIYGLNVVAWGGMLFLLLCNACTSSSQQHSSSRETTIGY